MNTKRIMKVNVLKGKEVAICLALGAGLFLGLPVDAREPEGGNGSAGWRVSAGPWFRNFEGGSFQTSVSHSASEDLPRGGTSSLLDPGAAGSESGSELRTYDDGFVGPDTLGSTPGSLFEGTTSRLGYQSDDQVSANSLTLSSVLVGSASSTSFSSADQADSWDEDPGFESGAQIEAAFLRPVSSGRMGVLFGFGWSPYEIRETAATFTAARVDRSYRVDGQLTDTYEVPGAVILPSGPYSQPDANPPPAFLPRIFDEPSRAIDSDSTRTGTTAFDWFNQIDQKFEADVFTFSLGPTAEVDLAELLFLSLSGGAALHVVDWRATSTETLYRSVNGGDPASVGRWRDQKHNTDLIWGGFLSCGAGLRFGEDERYFLQGAARWDWAEDLSDSVGSTDFEVGFSSFSGTVTVGMRL